MKNTSKFVLFFTSFFLTGCTLTPTNVISEKKLEISDTHMKNYVVGEIFDNFVCEENGLNVKVSMSNNTTKDLKKSEFTYTIKDPENNDFDGTKAFENPGIYEVTVSREKLTSVAYDITVSKGSDVTLTSIKIDEKTSYTKTVYQNDIYVFDGKVIATYSDKTTKDVTELCDYSIVNTSTLGKATGRITYDGIGITYSVTVIEKPVDPVPVTSLTVTPTSVTLVKNQTKQISATVLPSNATNKKLSYTSSSTSIATVSNTGLITAKAKGSATITVKTTDGSNIQKTVAVTVNESSSYDDEWTLLIYMCGSTLESDRSQGGAATEDLTEIYGLRSDLPDDVNVVIQAGGASSWKSTYSSVINKNYRNRFHLTKSGFVKDSQDTKVNMGDESSLKDFVEWGLKTYPAKKVGLIFWNHGGAMEGCCFDEQFEDEGLTPAEVSRAVPAGISAANYTNKLEFIGYDCCLMSAQDIAGLNSEYANYMIASEESEWGYGWSYDKFVDDIFDKASTTTILKACVDGFALDTTEAYEYWEEDNDQTLAYYSLANWDAYETAWEDFASYLATNKIKSSSNWSTFASVAKSAKRFCAEDRYTYDLVDVKDFLDKMKASSSYKSDSTLMSKISTIQSAFNGLNIYSWHGDKAGNANGLAMFCPLCGKSPESCYDDDNTCFVEWRDLCLDYGNWY